MYWTNELVEETEMWHDCWLLKSWRRQVAKRAFSPARVGDSLFVEVGELMDGFKFPDMLYWW